MSKTPKAVLKAAFPATTAVAGVTLPPLSILSYLALEAIQSPLVQNTPKGAKVGISIADMATAVALMNCDPDTMSDLVSRYLLGGEDAKTAAAEIRQLAMKVAATIPIWQLKDMTNQLRKQIELGFSTAVAMRDPEDGSPLARRMSSKPTTAAGAGRSS